MTKSTRSRRHIAPALLLLSSACTSSTAFLSAPSSPCHQDAMPTSKSNASPVSTVTSLGAAFIDHSYPHESAPPGNGEGTAAATSASSSIPAARPPRSLPNGATLTLVGAGPGSPDLLTVAAHRIITDPNNFLVVDRLVSDEILDLIEGEYRVANKHPGCQHAAQEEIYDWCREGLEMGKHVVRLKIGEPALFTWV